MAYFSNPNLDTSLSAYGSLCPTFSGNLSHTPLIPVAAVPNTTIPTAEDKSEAKKLGDADGLRAIGIMIGITAIMVLIAAYISYGLSWESQPVEMTSLDKGTALRKVRVTNVGL